MLAGCSHFHAHLKELVSEGLALFCRLSVVLHSEFISSTSLICQKKKKKDNLSTASLSLTLFLYYNTPRCTETSHVMGITVSPLWFFTAYCIGKRDLPNSDYKICDYRYFSKKVHPLHFAHSPHL